MKFSVIIPVYNGQQHILRSIGSVLSQTFGDYELIVIDDGSTDETAELVRKVIEDNDNSHIRLIQQQNAGVSAARNAGIDAAVGEFICFLDSDDQWFTDHLENLDRAVQTYPQEVFFSTLSQTCLLDGSIASQSKELPEETFVIDDYFEYELSGKPSISKFTSTICLKSEVFLKIGKFATGVKLSEDEDMWYRAAAYHNFVVIPRTTVQRNRDFSQATRFVVNPETDKIVEREKEILSDETIPASKRKSISLIIQRHKIRLIRSMIKNGHKGKALRSLFGGNFDGYYRKELITTVIALFIPQFIIKKMEKRKTDLNYYHASDE